MSTIMVPADAWDALDDTERQAAIDAARVPVALGTPARLRGTFDVDGNFTPDDGGPEWCAWDDHRLTEAHAVALAAALED